MSDFLDSIVCGEPTCSHEKPGTLCVLSHDQIWIHSLRWACLQPAGHCTIHSEFYREANR